MRTLQEVLLLLWLPIQYYLKLTHRHSNEKFHFILFFFEKESRGGNYAPCCSDEELNPHKRKHASRQGGGEEEEEGGGVNIHGHRSTVTQTAACKLSDIPSQEVSCR